MREVIEWHFDPATGCPFWLNWAAKAGWDPRREVHCYADLDKFGGFEDEWLRGGPVRQWVPKGHAGKPVYIFETGGSTGVPKARINIDDFRIDYESFSKTLPTRRFRRVRTGSRSAPAARADCDWRSSTCASTAAASVLAWTSTRAG